jgi:glycosidase
MKKKILYGVVATAFVILSIVYSNSRGARPEAIEASVKINSKIESYVPKEGYEERVFYEVFVRSFNDSNGDGVGDLKGLTQKLDYLKDLGIKGMWLMPINASPSYHGYDVTNYYEINPQYGTMEDYQELIREAHKRDMLVVMDLVLNHTSAYHPWFIASKTDKESKYRGYYLWADEKTDKKEISSINTKPWIKLKSLSNEYYYAIFAGNMPDLNYDNTEVRQQAKDIAKFYLNMGVDGFRLDAAKHIYDNDNTKSADWWKEFNDYVKNENKNALLIGEVWDKPEVVKEYMKGLDTCFNFEASEIILKSLFKNDISRLSTDIKSIYDGFKSIDKNYKDSIFLSNHDTARAMSRVQDVERFTDNPTERAKRAAAILLTLPGTPYIYYGEETGMRGNKPDEQIREPFIWDNKDKKKNTSWQTSINHPDNIAVSVLTNKPDSIWSFYKNLIALRNGSKILKFGSLEVVEAGSSNVLAYKRVYEDKEVYVLVNGNSDQIQEKLALKDVKILYSNKRDDKQLNINGLLQLKGEEILIIEK